MYAVFYAQVNVALKPFVLVDGAAGATVALCVDLVYLSTHQLAAFPPAPRLIVQDQEHARH